MFQTKYNIVHSDLHMGNIFLERVTKDTVWNGRALSDVDYFEYTLPSGRSIYTQKIPVLVKIGDWGHGCKYSTPRILQRYVINNEYQSQDGTAQIANFYNTSYDVLMAISEMYRMNPNVPLVSKLLAWCFSVDDTPTAILDAADKNFIKATGRPRIDKLEGLNGRADALSILENEELMGDFLTVPPKGAKVATLGRLPYR